MDEDSCFLTNGRDMGLFGCEHARTLGLDNLDAGDGRKVRFTRQGIGSQFHEELVEHGEVGWVDVRQLRTVQVHQGGIEACQEFQALWRYGNVDGAAVLAAAGPLGQALRLEPVEQAGDVWNAGHGHFRDFVAEATGPAIAAQDAENIVRTRGEVAGFEESFKWCGQLALRAGEVQKNFLFEGFEREAFSEIVLER